jgi:hypothetical protein
LLWAESYVCRPGDGFLQNMGGPTRVCTLVPIDKMVWVVTREAAALNHGSQEATVSFDGLREPVTRRNSGPVMSSVYSIII